MFSLVFNIVLENHYYPFVMQMNGDSHKQQFVKNDYLYYGKEMNTEIGLNWSDYGETKEEAGQKVELSTQVGTSVSSASNKKQ